LLKIENLSTGYGKIQAIRDVNISVALHQMVSVIGANGAGKSTLLSSVCGLVPVWGGRVFFEDKEITGVPTEKMMKLGIALVPEGGKQFFESLTTLDNLLLGAYYRRRKGENKDKIKKDIEFVYKIFPRLQERREQLAGTLSGGEARMLTLGMCLMSKPKLLLLDEPSLGLAPIVIKEIYRVVLNLFNEGLTILLVEQNVRIALDISNQAYVMETGKIVLEGKSSELLNNEAVKKAYLGG
jgi:branched-chain amino acid transport system ATP-binding protein